MLGMRPKLWHQAALVIEAFLHVDDISLPEFLGRRKLVQTSWDLEVLDTCELVPLKLSAVGSHEHKWPGSISKKLAEYFCSASVTVQQLWGDGWRGGCSSSYIFKAGGCFKMYVSILIAVF